MAIGINYRLDQKLSQAIQDGQPFPPGEDVRRVLDAIVAAQHDAQAAVRWVRANASSLDVDPANMVIRG